MKRVFVITIALLILATPVLAQVRPVIKTLGILGKGVAVSLSDPMDFKMLKVGIGTVTVSLLNETTELTVGVLFLDDERYRLKDIVIENGSASADVYLNDTQVGSVQASSVMKGNIEVWAGTLDINGKTYYIYVLEGHRPIRAVELREKVAYYCRDNPEDENCSGRIAEFCENNPNDARCLAIFKRYCIAGTNMDDTRCREFMNRYCEEHPEENHCRLLVVTRARNFCKENPDSEQCRNIELELVDFCMRNPNIERCREFCAEYPEKCKNLVKNLADFCIENSNHTNCVQYCRENPKACTRLAKNLADFCIKQPDSAECVEYCRNHPVACKIVTAELARFCIGNEDNERCVTYCENHPFACRKVTTELEAYCSNNNETEECLDYCERFPARCRAVKQIRAVVEKAKSLGQKLSNEALTGAGG